MRFQKQIARVLEEVEAKMQEHEQLEVELARLKDGVDEDESGKQAVAALGTLHSLLKTGSAA